MVLGIALVSGGAVACGGRVTGPDADGGAASSQSSGSSAGQARDGGGGNGGSFEDVDFPACPAAPPLVGTACVSPHTGCAYFTQGSCEAFVCDASGQWQASTEGC
jgi:hypothetical protein